MLQSEKKYTDAQKKLKGLLDIGQQCGCINVNVKRKANKEKENCKVRRRSNTRGREVEGIKKLSKGRMSNCCVGYYEVDLLLTLYVETGRGQYSQLVAH